MRIVNKLEIANVKKGKRKVGRGDLLRYLNGKRIPRGAAIRAKCYDCNGMGELDTCSIETCPLYPYSPYRVK